MENDETTAGRPQEPAGEQPRRRSRRGTTPTPAPDPATPADATALAAVAGPSQDVVGTGGASGPVAAAALDGAAETPAPPARRARSRARPAATPVAAAAPVAPRRGVRAAVTTEPAAPEQPPVPPTAAPVAAAAAQTSTRPSRARRATRTPAKEAPAVPEEPAQDTTLPDTIRQLIETAHGTHSSAVAPGQEPVAAAPAIAPAQERLPYVAQSPTAVQRDAEGGLEAAGGLATLEATGDGGQDVQPEEARSTRIAAGLRTFFAALPDPGDEALQPSSFLRGLAVELHAAGVRPPAPAGASARQEPLMEPDDELMDDVSQSLDDLDLEHASSAGEGLGDAASAPDDQSEGGEGDKGEERLFGRRRRRRGGRGRGGLPGRADGDGDGSADVSGLGGTSLEFPTAGEDEQPLTAREVASAFTAPPAAPAVPAPAVPQRSWKDQSPRRPWLAQGALTTPPNVTTPSVAGEVSDPRRQATPPDRERRDPDPFGMPSALSALPAVSEPFGRQGGGIEGALERQSALLQTFLERQSRLLEAVVNGVSVLRRSVDDVVARQERMATEQRAGLPRTGIFVDAPNVCYAADASKVSLDFSRMLSHLSRGREVVHAIAYAPVSEEARDGQRYESQRFVAPFARKGFKMVTKPLKRYPDGTAKGNFDIELAIDIVTMSERLDVVVLVSGDSDFSRLVELVQSKGVRVEVVAFASSVATELVHMADVFVDIGQNLDYFRQL